jgi:transcriptional regulator with XRE-family HTH domain
MLSVLNIMHGLRARREELDLSQADLARAAGISRTSLSQIENRKWRPSLETVEALEASLDPFESPVLLRCGDGPLAAAALVRGFAKRHDLPYAITLDVAAWTLTHYQTPGTTWAYVRPLERWSPGLKRGGFAKPDQGERADLILLRAPENVLEAATVREGLSVVSDRQLLQDCARLGGRHTLDAARIFVGFPEARSPGLRLDADALLKVFEEVSGRT